MRQLGNCAPHATHCIINTQRPATSAEDVQAIADLIHQSASADLEAMMNGAGRRRPGTDAFEITPEDRKSSGYRELAKPNPDLKITILTLQQLN